MQFNKKNSNLADKASFDITQRLGNGGNNDDARN